MKHATAKLALVMAMAVIFTASAQAVTIIDYGWEDAGDILGMYPAESLVATNVASWDSDPVHSGNFSLKLERVGTSTPQGFLAFLWNLQDGDEITVGFWRYDVTPADAPSGRLWGHWNDELPGNPAGYSGSAGGNSEYGPGEGWDYTSWVYTVAGNTGLVIEARVYSSPGDIIYVDDLHIEVPDHVFVQIPGCSPVGVEEDTWGGVKALFR